ncbi:MAG: NTP transferase domain-containing protein [Nitrososphaeraceae archaeon]
MLALIMCGGKGERIKDFCSEKAMLSFNNKPLIEYILKSLEGSKQFDKIYAATSCNSKLTLEFLKTHPYYFTGFLSIIETSGTNYSTDLMIVLERLKPYVVFVMPSDMPLISHHLIRRIISNWKGDKQCISIILDREFIIKLGLIPTLSIKLGNKEYFHSGITIFDSSKIQAGQVIKEHYITLNNERLAFNINTKKDFFLLRSKKFNQEY